MNKPHASQPFVSVIMPVYNEGNFIRRSLGALVNQTYPEDLMEIIVADGMSADKTSALIEEIAFESNVPIRIVENVKQIAAAGLNQTLRIANGNIIVRIDGHTIVEADYVSECVEALMRTGAGNAGGKMNAVSQGAVGNSITLATSSRFGIGNARFHYSDREEYVDTVYLGAWPRRIFEQYGLFNEELVRNQDDEFNYRIRANGEKILLSPRIKSNYYSRSTFKSLWRQYFQYGYWKVRVLQMHPKQMSMRQFVPAALVLSLILTSILSLLTPLGTWAFIAVASSYLIANIAASFLTAKTHLALIPLISLGFAILHFSYGFGFLLGVFSFAGHWFRTKSSDALPVDH